MDSFTRTLVTAFTTKRLPAKIAGRQSAPVAHLVAGDLRCAPLDPADGATTKLLREQLERQVRIFETYTPDLDIVDGDTLTVDGREYPVRRVERWRWRTSWYLRLLVEDL